MRVEILGTRGNIPVSAPKYARHAGVLIDRRILLDLGEISYLRRRPRQIFVTDLHPDHAAFLTTGGIADSAVYLPERSPIVPSFRLGPPSAGSSERDHVH